MPFSLPALAEIDLQSAATFQRDGFLVIERVLSVAQIDALRAELPRLFAGRFDTGVFPDEWYWREGMSLPDVTRHMTNAWKSDLTVARLVLSEDIARAAATLTGWDGLRLGQDTIWWKPPGTKAVNYHQDTSFMDFLSPPKTMTCWFVLDDTQPEAGTLEYVPGSHRWPLTGIPEDFHAPYDFRAAMHYAARMAGVEAPPPRQIVVPAGSCVFHAGEIWHGSGPNTTDGRVRRSIGVHMVPSDATFSERPGGYIYRRYQLTGDRQLNESFFPLLWQRDGSRTAWIERYCEDGRR